MVHEIQTKQSVVEVSVQVESNAEIATSLLADEKWEEASEAVHRISRDLVDPLNEGADDVFARGAEGNGVGPDEAAEIGDNNLSVGELAL